MAKNYKVTINKRGHIPGIGNGPFLKPLYIDENLYNDLIKLGYPVNLVEYLGPKKESIPNKKNLKVVEEIKKEDLKLESEKDFKQLVNEEKVDLKVNKTPSKVEEVKKEENEDTIEEIEVVLNDPDLSADSYYEQDFLTSKAMCKKILNKRKVQYEDSASLAMLKNLVKDSNPEIEE